MCTDKHLDMSLAKSYQPVLLCVVKVSILTGFHVVSGVILFPVEKWGVVAAGLLVDKWIGSEFVIDSNGCVATTMASLLVQELRYVGIQSRVYHPLVSDLVLAALFVSNLLATAFGETWCVLTPPGAEGSSKRFRLARKGESGCGHLLTHGLVGQLICLVNTCALLVVLTSCTMTGGSQDVLLLVVRVCLFTTLSLVWFYTVHYGELTYNSVSHFTPCLVRFNSVLHLPSLVLTLGGVTILTACLSATYLRSLNCQALPHTILPSHSTPSLSLSNTPTTVVRETSSNSVVSYRVPVTQKLSTVPSGVEFLGPGGASMQPSHPEAEHIPASGETPALDYNYLFAQASLEHRFE